MNRLLTIALVLLFSFNSSAQNFSASDPNISVTFGSRNRARNNAAPSQNQQRIQNYNLNSNNAPETPQILTDKQILLQQKIAEKPKYKLNCDVQGKVCVITNTFKDKVVIELENRTYATRTVKINTNFENIRSLEKVGGKYEIILKGKERKYLDTLLQIDPTKSFSFNYDYTSIRGNKDAVHNDKYVYDLPFQFGKKYKLMQGYGGSFSHNTPETYYAYDFKMKNKSQIMAAREGRVIKVTEKYSQGGKYKSLKRKANNVEIEHPDGTIGIYAHFYKKGVIVQEGDYVQRGQMIGYSGNTGYSTGPHLHFAVAKMTKDGNYISLPIRIRTSDEISRQLKTGRYYQK